MKSDSPRNPFKAPKTTQKHFGLRSANTIGFCPPDCVKTWIDTVVIEKLKAYLNFRRGAKTDVIVSNRKTHLSITIKVFW